MTSEAALLIEGRQTREQKQARVCVRVYARERAFVCDLSRSRTGPRKGGARVGSSSAQAQRTGRFAAERRGNLLQSSTQQPDLRRRRRLVSGLPLACQAHRDGLTVIQLFY